MNERFKDGSFKRQEMEPSARRSLEMGSRNQVSCCCVQEEGCTDEGDAGKQRIAETFSRHHVRGTADVIVRELRSEGLSFQLWPAANAMCLYIEKEFGEGGMFMIDALPPYLERDITRWDNTYAALLERNLVIGDRVYEGFYDDPVVDDILCSVHDNGAVLGISFDSSGRQKPSSNGGPEAEVLQDIGNPLASTNIGNQMDPLHLLQDIEGPLLPSCNIGDQMDPVGANFDTTHRQTMMGTERSALQDIGNPLASTNIGNQMDPLQLLQDIEGPVLPSGNIGNHMDPVGANVDTNHRKTMKGTERSGAHVVDKFDIPLSLSLAGAGGNIHFPRRRMRLLELGSGTGMVGIVAACLGAQVVLTDLPHVLANLSHNLDLNKGVIAAAGGSAEAKVLRWGVEEDVKALGERSFDLILASDCVYHDTSYKPFLQTLNWLTRSPDTDYTNISNDQQRQPTIPKGVSSALPSQLLEPALCLLSLSKTMPFEDTIDPYDKVTGKDTGEQPAFQIDKVRRSVSSEPTLRSDTKEQQGRASNECAILLGHMRRWKKDSKFFRMAAKLFDVGVVHRHPPRRNDRIGPIVYRLSTKSGRKCSSSRTRSTSSIGSLSSCSPSRR